MVLAAAVLFSTGGAAIKATSLTGWQVASFRSGFAALALLVFLPRSRRLPTTPMWLVGIVYAATLVLFVTATKLTTAANAIFLQDTSPLYVVLLSPLVLRERVKWADVWFMVALAAGLVAFFLGHEAPRESASNPHRGDLLAVASGLTWAATIIGLRWLSTRTQDPDASEPALVAGNIMAFLATLPFALPTGATTTTDWAIVIYLGVIQIGLAYVCFSIGMAGVPAIEASLLLLLEPVLNPVFSWLVHGEVPNRWSMAGGAIILSATAARTVWDARMLSRRDADRHRGSTGIGQVTDSRGSDPPRMTTDIH
jgi:drug/metabolite transporter, DME family